MCSGWSGNAVTSAACEKLYENQGWLPSTREQDFKSLLISFSLFDTYFLKVGRSITFNKTYWMMQVVSWNAVVLYARSTAKTRRYLFHLLLSLCASLCFVFFCLAGKFSRFKTAVEEMSPSSIHVHKIETPGYQRGSMFLKAVIR